MKKILSLFLFALVLTPSAFSATFYGKLTTRVGNTGGGKVYASSSNAENKNYYGDPAQASVTKLGFSFWAWASSASVSGLYAYARPDEGYRFLGWATGASSTSYESYMLKYAHPNITATSKDQNKATEVVKYAHFQEIVPATIHLAVGDQVVLHYDVAAGTTTAKYGKYSSNNGTIVDVQVEGEGASSGDYRRGCKVTVTALDAGRQTITLTRQVKDDTLYGSYDILNFVVSENREVRRGDVVTISPACSSAGAGSTTWTGPTSSNAKVATVSTLANKTATGASFTLTGVDEGEVTVTAKNTTGGTTTALKGAEYTYTAKIIPTPTTDLRMTRDSYFTVYAGCDVMSDGAYSLDKTSANGITASVVRGDESGCEVRFAVSPTAAIGTVERFTVKKGTAMFRAYNVIVSDVMTVTIGQAESDLETFADMPYFVGSDDPEIASLVATGGGFQQNFRAEAYKLGSCVTWATNVNATLGYDVRRVKVTSSATRDVVVAKDETLTFVSGPADQRAYTWSASSANTQVAIASITAGGDAGQTGVAISGKRAGQTTTVTAKTDFFTETFNVRVVSSIRRESFELGIGESEKVTKTADFGKISSVTCSNEQALEVKVIDNGTLEFIGHFDGHAKVTVESTNYTAIYEVDVHQKHIAKTIDLAYSAVQGKGTEHAESFRQILSIGEPSVAGIVGVVQEGPTVTFKATKVGETELVVTCLLDGSDLTYTYTYTLVVADLGNKGVWPFGRAYVAYENVSDIRELDNGDLLLTFENPAQAGAFEIPEPFTAVADVLVVGGGGAGGDGRTGNGGGGGGAGGYVTMTDFLFDQGTYAVSVGRGGRVTEEQGGSSQIVKGEDRRQVFAEGGGRGGSGANAAEAHGRNGGSGGGAAWYEADGEFVAGDGGFGMDGYGTRGGMPTVLYHGAGGGGAANLGGADGSGGLGARSSITGEEVLYAQGGEGASPSESGHAMTGIGFGGNGGAANGAGGIGGDGAVYVRVKRLQRTILVPVPTEEDLLRLRFAWSNGLLCKPFDYVGKTFRSPSNAEPYQWEDVIQSVEGTSELTCRLNGKVKEGLGYHDFTVRLKDGFAWDVEGDVGSMGSTDPLHLRWSVVADASVTSAEIDLEKYISSVAAENAVLTLRSYTSPEKNGDTVKPYDLTLSDQLKGISEGLVIDGLTLSVSVDGRDWTQVVNWKAGWASAEITSLGEKYGATGHVDTEANRLDLQLKNVTEALWAKVDVAVHDTGTFRTNIGAAYDPKTGLYAKSPNEGPASLTMSDASNGSEIAACTADLTAPWRYKAYEVAVKAVNGAIEINGTNYNPYALPEDSDVVVTYRAQGGYELTKLLVDNSERPITSDRLTHYTFHDISAAHTVYVEFTRFYGGVSIEPLMGQTYDGKPHVYTVTLTDWSPKYATEVRYAMNLDAADDDYLPEAEFLAANADTLKNVGTYRFAYRVFAMQPGWGADPTQEGWVWVNTGRQGTSVVEIIPLDVTVAPNYQQIKAQKPFPDPGWNALSEFAEGEDRSVLAAASGNWKVTVEGYDTSRKETSGEGMYPTHLTGVADGDVIGNYCIRVRAGVLSVEKNAIQIGGIPQSEYLDPDDEFVVTGVAPVDVVYDGQSHGLAIEVTDPDDGGYEILYSLTGNDNDWSSTPIVFTHVQEKTRVHFKVVPTGANTGIYFEAQSYQYVTVRPRPVTLTSATATKMYDGTPLVAHEVTATEGSIAAGDTLAFAFPNSQTAVDSVVNAFTYELSAGSVGSLDDYVITPVEGLLTVTEGALVIGGVTHPTDARKPLPYGKTGVADIEKPYDGVPVTTLDIPVGNASVYTVTYSLDGGKTWSETFSLVEAGEYFVHFRVKAANFATVENFAKVTIQPRVTIVDHGDAGNGKVALAFELQGLAEPLTVTTLHGMADRIMVVCADSESGLMTAEPEQAVLQETQPDLGANRIWIVLTPPAMRPLYCKIVIR